MIGGHLRIPLIIPLFCRTFPSIEPVIGLTMATLITGLSYLFDMF